MGKRGNEGYVMGKMERERRGEAERGRGEMGRDGCGMREREEREGGREREREGGGREGERGKGKTEGEVLK